ncbi:MAG: apolipoprotein N-acyltransferase [Alphaproteobacteria bacterium]
MTVWLRLLAAAMCGVAAALALAPLYLWPLMLLGYGGLFWFLNQSGHWRQAFTLGWAFGVGYFLVGLHWVGHAFMVDADRFAWMMPIALIALAGGLGLFPGLVLALTRGLSRPGPSRLFAFALFWGLGEWLRGTLLTGFPWLMSGHVWAAGDGSLQAAAYLGTSVLGPLAVMAAAAPALFVTAPRKSRRAALLTNGLVFAVLGLVLVISQLRLQEAAVALHPEVRLRLVQAGIAQADKWRTNLRDQHLDLYLKLSLEPGANGRPAAYSHLIWPETATPFFLADDPARRGFIARSLPLGTMLITGTPRRGRSAAGAVTLHNSIMALAADGAVARIYDKAHLVPFGEYLPLRSALARLGLDKLAHGAVDFSPGFGPIVAKLPDLPPFRPLICYEIIFSREIAAPDYEAKPEWLLNVTNDAWFGDSFGPRQHLDIARMRAVEQGLPVVRVANTGISAIIGPFGRISAHLPLGAAGVIDSGLPKALPETLYRRFGDGIFAIFCLLLGCSSFFTYTIGAKSSRLGK